LIESAPVALVSEETAHAAMDRFDFDSTLFPPSLPMWFGANFGPSVYKRAKKTGKLLCNPRTFRELLAPG